VPHVVQRLIEKTGTRYCILTLFCFVYTPEDTFYSIPEQKSHKHTTNMCQTSWDEIPISNKLKSIKKKITKWHIQPNISRRSEIINTRTRIGHIPTSPTYTSLKTKNNLSVADAMNRSRSNT